MAHYSKVESSNPTPGTWCVTLSKQNPSCSKLVAQWLYKCGVVSLLSMVLALKIPSPIIRKEYGTVSRLWDSYLE